MNIQWLRYILTIFQIYAYMVFLTTFVFWILVKKKKVFLKTSLDKIGLLWPYYWIKFLTITIQLKRKRKYIPYELPHEFSTADIEALKKRAQRSIEHRRILDDIDEAMRLPLTFTVEPDHELKTDYEEHPTHRFGDVEYSGTVTILPTNFSDNSINNRASRRKRRKTK